ncbi:hypothetical protein [Paracidovorax sp. MALMAid1276]|uniref:hypothetical protein n=1 Tax=Paracidovorax sp. MALMAid1276 TaxID=3411631 RepID=UPI003B9CF431
MSFEFLVADDQSKGFGGVCKSDTCQKSMTGIAALQRPPHHIHHRLKQAKSRSRNTALAMPRTPNWRNRMSHKKAPGFFKPGAFMPSNPIKPP